MGHLLPGWTLVNPAQQQALSLCVMLRDSFRFDGEIKYSVLFTKFEI